MEISAGQGPDVLAAFLGLIRDKIDWQMRIVDNCGVDVAVAYTCNGRTKV